MEYINNEEKKDMAIKVKAKYSKPSILKETDRLIDKLHKGFEPKMSLVNFYQELAEFYQKRHCPECGNDTSTIQPCNCKRN